MDVLIKPVSGKCNLNCRYCFYREEMSTRRIADRGIMSRETMQLLIEQVFEIEKNRVSFAFQGGEPMLMGMEFYREFVACIAQNNIHGIPVSYSLQTNGTLLTDEWCEFFVENHFLIGVSLDGYEETHNLYRTDKDGDGSFNRVMAGLHMLGQHSVDFNILCVVTDAIAHKGKLIYSWLRDQGFRYLQFIPCLTCDGVGLESSSFGEFMCDVFDSWYEDYMTGNYVSIRTFDNWVRMLMGMEPETCSMAGHCSVYGCIEADGSVYPCDFYAVDTWCLGNIHSLSLKNMLQGEVAHRFVCDSCVAKDSECRICAWRTICRGGCRRNREISQNIFCDAYKRFFNHAYDRLCTAAVCELSSMLMA